MMCTVAFRVSVNAVITSGQKVCLTGDAEELGGWSSSTVIPMQRQDEMVNMPSSWSVELTLPRDKEVRYRYAVCSFHGDDNDSVRVHHWESARVSRTVLPQGEKIMVNDDQFGTFNGGSKVERGWLTSHSEVRLMFHSRPFTPTTGTSMSAYSIHVSMSSLDGTASFQAMSEEGSPTKIMKQCGNLEPVNIRVLNCEEYQPHQQEPHGRICRPGDYLVFSAQAMKPESVVFTIDLSDHRDGANGSVSIGKSWLLGRNVNSDTNQHHVLPVLSGAQTVGVLSVSSLVIHPLSPPSLCSMETSYATYWKWNRPTLEGGHRGFGRSHHDSSLLQNIPVYSQVPENTIRAFQKGSSHGADFVEFDVNVTKDRIPIVYHDCEAKLSVKETSGNGSSPLKLPFWEMTLDQVRSLRNGHSFVIDELLASHVGQGESSTPTEADLPEEIRPFPELQEVLHSIPVHCGANIEVKYPMSMEDNTKESDFQPPDRNIIVDAILKVVLGHGGNRRIMFSAFDADICIMLRLKQNKYPVIFLNYGRTDKYLCYRDPRNNIVANAMFFALSEEMLGLCCHSDDLIRDHSILSAANDRGLVVHVWGENNNKPEVLQLLKDMEVQGIIHDRIGLNPENSPNIYLREKLAVGT